MRSKEELAQLGKKIQELRNDMVDLTPEEMEEVMKNLPLSDEELDSVDGAGLLFIPCTVATNFNVTVNANANANANANINANINAQANANAVVNANLGVNANATINTNTNSNTHKK